MEKICVVCGKKFDGTAQSKYCSVDCKIKEVIDGVENPIPTELNETKGRANTSGHRGVYYDKLHSKWRAEIHYNGSSHKLGTFTTKEDAVQARQTAEIQMYGKLLGGETLHTLKDIPVISEETIEEIVKNIKPKKPKKEKVDTKAEIKDEVSVDDLTDMKSYVKNLSDIKLAQLSTSLYEYFNNEFMILYNKSNLTDINVMIKLVLDESGSRFIKSEK